MKNSEREVFSEFRSGASKTTKHTNKSSKHIQSFSSVVYQLILSFIPFIVCFFMLLFDTSMSVRDVFVISSVRCEIIYIGISLLVSSLDELDNRYRRIDVVLILFGALIYGIQLYKNAGYSIPQNDTIKTQERYAILYVCYIVIVFFKTFSVYLIRKLRKM